MVRNDTEARSEMYHVVLKSEKDVNYKEYVTRIPVNESTADLVVLATGSHYGVGEYLEKEKEKEKV